jgi:uncharacterized Fe-S cluster-containing radical SAM superfamily enzyme
MDRGGNRQINRALHVIAITRGRLDPGTRAYLQRKEAEGKTRIEAMRCLKRHLARHYHRLLLRPVSTSGCTKEGSEQSDRQDAAGFQLHRLPQLGACGFNIIERGASVMGVRNR